MRYLVEFYDRDKPEDLPALRTVEGDEAIFKVLHNAHVTGQKIRVSKLDCVIYWPSSEGAPTTD